MKRREFCLSTALLTTYLGLSKTAFSAAKYPNHAIKFIVPWGPGGGSDTLMRIIANGLHPILGVDVPVINMPGVGGTVGLKNFAKARPDGYTISQIHEGLLTSHATGITPLNWDSFKPIALMTASPQYLVVSAKAPYKTMDEFIAYARNHKVTMGVTLGGVPHLDAALIADAYGVEFSYVGYEGTGQRIRALVGGNLDAAIGDISSSKQFVDNGDLRFLCIGSATRNPQTPDVPTLQELGKDVEMIVTRGIVLPKKTPNAICTTLEAALKILSTTPSYIEQTNNAGAQVDFHGQADYTNYLAKLDKKVQQLANILAP